MSQLFRKQQTSEYDAPHMYKPIKVVPSAYWLMYIGGLLIVAVVIVWMCVGWTVETADMLGIYHPGAAKPGEIICFPPLSIAKTVEPGMEATAYVSGFNQQEYGHMKATVSYVDSYVTSVDEMRLLLGDDLLVNSFLQNGPVAAVVCKLEEDPASANGYAWSSERGGSLNVQDGSYVTVSVAVSKVRPLSIGMPIIYQLFS